MAKAYAVKRRSTGRVASRHFKKKSPSRVSKKSATSTATKLKSIVAGEVLKALNSGAHSQRRKVTMSLCMQDKNVYTNGKKSLRNCLRIPVTQAIPAQAGNGHGPDDRRRHSNKILLTGVNVRASFSVSEETRVMFVLYEPHEEVLSKLRVLPCDVQPSAVEGKVPETFTTVLQGYYNMGLVSKHGPFMTKKSGAGVALDSVDDTPFESRVSTHDGKPLGSVFRKKFGGDLRKTLNWNGSGQAAGGVGLGATAWSTANVNEYWKLKKPLTYMHEVMNEQIFERNIEMMMYVDCPSPDGDRYADSVPYVGAIVRNVVVDLYFRDL